MRRTSVGALLVLASVAGCGGGSSHRTSPASTTTTTVVFTGPLVPTGETVVPVRANQGVARVPGGWIFSGTDVLVRTDDDLRDQVVVTPAVPDAWKARGYKHVGDIDVVGDYVYAPFEQPDFEKGEQANARYDARTLQFVDAVVVAQHENSFVTVDEKTMTAYSMDRFDGDTLLRYDVAGGWKPLPPLQLSTKLIHTQGADVAGGAVWISTSDDHNGLYRVDIATGRVDDEGSMGHPKQEGEGIDATDLPSGLLHTLVVSPASTTWFGHLRAVRVT